MIYTIDNEFTFRLLWSKKSRRIICILSKNHLSTVNSSVSCWVFFKLLRNTSIFLSHSNKFEKMEFLVTFSQESVFFLITKDTFKTFKFIGTSIKLLFVYLIHYRFLSFPGSMLNPINIFLRICEKCVQFQFNSHYYWYMYDSLTHTSVYLHQFMSIVKYASFYYKDFSHW